MENLTKEDLINLLQVFEEKITTKIVNQLKIKREFYTTGEFSKLTGLEEQTLVNYCNCLTIKAVKPKGQWLILASELDRLISEANQHHMANIQKSGKRDMQILNYPEAKRKKELERIYRKMI